MSRSIDPRFHLRLCRSISARKLSNVRFVEVLSIDNRFSLVSIDFSSFYLLNCNIHTHTHIYIYIFFLNYKNICQQERNNNFISYYCQQYDNESCRFET